MLQPSANLSSICSSSTKVSNHIADAFLPALSPEHYGHTTRATANSLITTGQNEKEPLKRTCLSRTAVESLEIASSPPLMPTTTGLSATSTTDFFTRQTSTTSSETLSSFFFQHSNPGQQAQVSSSEGYPNFNSSSSRLFPPSSDSANAQPTHTVPICAANIKNEKCRSGTSVDNIMNTFTRESNGNAAPSVKLPLMASFPSTCAEIKPSATKDFDRQNPNTVSQLHSTASSASEIEPSSFLRMRVQSFQRRHPRASSRGPMNMPESPDNASFANNDNKCATAAGSAGSWNREPLRDQGNTDSAQLPLKGRIAERVSGTSSNVNNFNFQQQSFAAHHLSSQPFVSQPHVSSGSHYVDAAPLPHCSASPKLASIEHCSGRPCAIRSASMDTAPLDTPVTEDSVYPKPSGLSSPRSSSSFVRNQTANTRTKLSVLQDKIVRFEGQLQVESQHRRAAEENRLNVLREAIGSVEKTLNAEVRRRLEANKAIQSSFETQLSTLQTHVERSVNEKSRQVTDAIETLTGRIRAAENCVVSMREAQEVAAQKLSAEIEQAVAEIRTLKDHLDNELKARRQREAILLDRLTDVEKQLDSRLTLERGIREKDVNHLRSQLDSVHENHVALDEAFQQMLANKFHELKVALQQESQTREQADDDIVQALNHYTAALQSALSIANST